MAHNYPKWPENDARIYALFPQFFLTEKAVPQTFSLLECMVVPLPVQHFSCPSKELCFGCRSRIFLLGDCCMAWLHNLSVQCFKLGQDYIVANEKVLYLPT